MVSAPVPALVRVLPAPMDRPPDVVRLPGPLTLVVPPTDTGAAISWLPLVMRNPPVPVPITVRVPPVPEVIVYLLALSKTIVPTVRLPSSVTVRGAVIFPRKLATTLELSGTVVGLQLAATPQLPLLSTFHCGFVPGATCRTMS